MYDFDPVPNAIQAVSETWWESDPAKCSSVENAYLCLASIEEIGYDSCTRDDALECFREVWELLHVYREESIPEGTEEYDNEWGDICLDMANLHDACGITHEEID